MRDILSTIKQIRRDQNLRQEDVADKLFIAKETYNHIESGKIRLTLENYIKICKVLNIDPAAMLGNENEKTIKLTHKEIESLKSIYLKFTNIK